MTGQQALRYAIKVLEDRLKSYEEPNVTIEHLYPAMGHYTGKSFSLTIEVDWPERIINNVILGRFHSDGVFERVEEKDNSLAREGAEAAKDFASGVVKEEYNASFDSGEILDVESAHAAAERTLRHRVRGRVETPEARPMGQHAQTGPGRTDDEARDKRDEHPEHGTGHPSPQGTDS